MKEGNSLPLRAESGSLIDESDAGLATAVQHVVQVVHGETDVMDTGTAFRDELSNGRAVRLPFEKFYERFATRDSGNAGTIGVVQGYFRHQQHITQEWQQLVDGTHSESDMGNARTAALDFRHVDFSVCWRTEF